LTEQNIGKLFLAAFIPGFLAVLGYLIVISIVARRNPQWAPLAAPMPFKERLKALVDTWQALVVFVLVIGGIYSGIFTTNEAASIGVLIAGAFAWFSGGLKDGVLWECLMDTAKTTGMLFFILLGADVFNVFLALSGMPAALAETVGSWQVSPMWVMLAVLALYIVLGCVMDSISMLLLTVPIFFPMLMGLDFYGMTETQKAIWFGVIALSTVEMGLITPPVGMNVYVISSLSKDVPMSEVFKGIFPFLISDLVRIGLMLAFPAIVLYLL
jgi:tripartite ATP-independent transporter DctM subunit